MQKCLDVVYFLEPWTELGRPWLRYHNLRYQLGPQMSALSKLGCKVTVIMGESTFDKAIQDNYYLENVKFEFIKENELSEIFDNYLECTNSLHRGCATETQRQQYTSLIESKLGNTKPDVFISFLSPVDFLKESWKDTLVIYTEFGLFSRVPYPRSFYFDSCGIFEKSYVRKIENTQFSYSKAENDDFQNFKNAIQLDEGEKYAQSELSRFDKTILLPLQFSNYFGFDATSSYKSQYEFLIDSLNRIPDNIGVIVTEHTGWEKTINEHNYKYLSGKYPNLIMSDKILALNNSSQALIRKVDAVASVSSSVALQGVFWGKPIFAMGDSHLNTFNAGDIDNAEEIINTYDPHANNQKIMHLIKNYYVTEKYAYNGNWFLNKLLKMIEAKDNGKNPYADEIDSNYLQKLKSDIRNREYKMEISKKQKIEDTNEKTIISDFDIVSFDIFDTLIQRPLNMPHQMFLFMQDDARGIVGDKHFEFHKIRRVCEHRSRKTSLKEEVTIFDIYSQIQKEYALSDEIIKELIQLEIDTEMHFCEERVTGKNLYNLAKKLNKKIILISDFHIGEENVTRILEKCGYDGWHKLYVSCDINKTKKNGNLFEHVIIENDYDPKTMIHIGDNYESDIENAQSFKIKTIHTPKGTDLFFKNPHTNRVWEQEKNRVLYPTDSLAKASAALIGLSINKLHSNVEFSDQNSTFAGDANKFGYCVFGPLFTSFAIELATHGKDKNYAFLSRDGSIFLKVFKEIFGNYDSKYVYTSRRALSLPTLVDEDSILDSLLIPFNPSPLSKLLKNKYGFTDEQLDALAFPEDEDLSVDSVVHPANSLVALKKLFRLNKSAIIENAMKENGAATSYLNKMFNEKTVIVDIGYSGSLQSYIQKLTNREYKAHYLMTHLKGKSFHKNGIEMQSFLGDFIDHTSNSSPFKDRISFLEFICSNDEPSLSHYYEEGGEVKFQFKDENTNMSRRRIVSREIQSGIIEFARDYKRYFMRYNDQVDLDKSLVTQWLFDFLQNPTPVDAKLFNNISHEDSYSNNERRYIVADAERALFKKNSVLSAGEARDLISASDWKEGIRSILPAKKGTRKIAPDNSNFYKLTIVPRSPEHQTRSEILVENPFKSTIWKSNSSTKFQAKVNKLFRDPKRFFVDAIRKL